MIYFFYNRVGDKMYNMYIPLCGLIINIVLLVIYRLKVTNLRKENRIYFNMISDAFVLTFFCFTFIKIYSIISL